MFKIYSPVYTHTLSLEKNIFLSSIVYYVNLTFLKGQRAKRLISDTVLHSVSHIFEDVQGGFRYVCSRAIKQRITETKICVISQGGDKLRANHSRVPSNVTRVCNR